MFPPPALPATRSSLPSPLKSPTARASVTATATIRVSSSKVPSPLPRRMLTSFPPVFATARSSEQAKSRHLFRDFVDATAVTVTGSEVQVRFHKRAHNPLLVAAGFATTDEAIPWFGGKRL